MNHPGNNLKSPLIRRTTSFFDKSLSISQNLFAETTNLDEADIVETVFLVIIILIAA